MKIPKPHHSSALDSLEFKRTRQLMWQDIQKKARPGRVWSWDFSLVFKRLSSALAVGVILGIGFANFGSVLSPEAYADYTLTYEPGEEGEAPRFVLESKGEVDVEALSAQISFFPAVNYTIQRVDEDTVELVLERELEEEVEHKIALDDAPAAKNYEWTYEVKEDLEDTTAPVELIPEVKVIPVMEKEEVPVEPSKAEEKESSGWNLPFFEPFTAHEEVPAPVVVEIPEEVVEVKVESSQQPESLHVQTSSGVVEVTPTFVPTLNPIPTSSSPTVAPITPTLTVTPVVVTPVITPSSISGSVTPTVTPTTTPVTTAPVTPVTTSSAPISTPTTTPVVLLPDLTIEQPSLMASTGILKMWIANRSGVAIGANVDSQISVTLDGSATPQWVFMWSTIVNKILVETGVYEIQMKVKPPVGHTVKICVDSKNQIKESNEDNNCWEVKL